MALPTTGETFSQLLEHLRKAQEAAAMLGHLTRDNEPTIAQGWLAVSEMLKLTVQNVTKIATRGKIKWN